MFNSMNIFVNFKCDIQQNVDCVLLVSWRSCDRTKSMKVILFYSPPVDCSSPGNPQNGSVTYYTTNGSVAFYSCDPGLVPVMEMRAACVYWEWVESRPIWPELLCRYVVMISGNCSMSGYTCIIWWIDALATSSVSYWYSTATFSIIFHWG